MKDAFERVQNPTPLPALSHYLAKILKPIYYFFDWLFSSKFNPLYRSGTLAVWFITILLITGLYLSFFYSVSNPYSSVKAINDQVFIGNWVRSLHRYATVATLIAIFFHVLQLLAQGKNWGPRTLAWVSGVFLTLLFFVSAWTGYVMVWDLHGQKVAQAGAQILALLPFLHDILLAAFDGTSVLPAGFFFMNLFMHVALPVMLIMFLWVHTARLSRSVWLPSKTINIWSTVALGLLAYFWPVVLLEEATLNRIIGRIPIDLFSGFWITWIDIIGAPTSVLLLIILFALLIFIPWWWKPSLKKARAVSQVDTQACTGCMQCALDCPYEAIKMVARPDGKRKVAEITESHCVSCGICASACADFAIGPPGRSASEQKNRANNFCAYYKENSINLDAVLIACTNNHRTLQMIDSYLQSTPNLAVYSVECCGSLHIEVIEQIMQISKGVVLIGCPARNCFNRDGGDLLNQRIYEKRVPFLDRNIDRRRILITTFAEAEAGQLLHAIKEFRKGFSEDFELINNAKYSYNPHIRRLKTTLASFLMLYVIGYSAQVPVGRNPKHAMIRVAGLLPGAISEDCHEPTVDELSNMPMHMRPKQICTKLPLVYKLSISVNGQIVLDREIKDSRNRVDRPLTLEVEKNIVAGSQEIEIKLLSSAQNNVSCKVEREVAESEIFIAFYDRELNQLVCR